MDSYAAGFLANADLDQLCGDVIAIRVFHSNDGDTVRLTVDDDEACLVRGKSDGGRARRCRVTVNTVFALFIL